MRCGGKDPSTTEHQRPYDTCVTHLSIANSKCLENIPLWVVPWAWSVLLHWVELHWGNAVFSTRGHFQAKTASRLLRRNLQAEEFHLESVKQWRQSRQQNWFLVHFDFTSLFPCDILRRHAGIPLESDPPRRRTPDWACKLAKSSVGSLSNATSQSWSRKRPVAWERRVKQNQLLFCGPFWSFVIRCASASGNFKSCMPACMETLADFWSLNMFHWHRLLLPPKHLDMIVRCLSI